MWTSLKTRLLYGVLGRVPRDRAWVFGIGLSKTGTTSLSDALELLGYNAFHLPPVAKADGAGGIMMDWPWWVMKHDALSDLTVAVLWRELDSLYPNARFIYTPRDMESWLDSCRRHFTAELAEARVAQGQSYLNDLCAAFYGSHLYDEAMYRAAYLRHEAEVRTHFAGRVDFLDYDLIAGAGWEPLCDFLGHNVPDAPFPASNKGRCEARAS